MIISHKMCESEIFPSKKYIFQWAILIIISVHVSCQKERTQQGELHGLKKPCEAGLHRLIDEEIHASLTYTAMAAHFNNSNVSRFGFNKYFISNSKKSNDLMLKLIAYLNVRSGTFTGFNIKMPAKYNWNNGLDALRDAKSMEHQMNNKIHRLHDLAFSQCQDSHLTDFLEREFFQLQVESIDELHRHIAELKGMDTGMGEYLFDVKLSTTKMEL